MATSNPYTVGQWVRGERFYGRSYQVEEILQGPRDWIWLLGTRRVGKTSLLKQIELLASRSPEKRYFPVFWDFQGAEDSEELRRGFEEALLDAEERLLEIGLKPQELGNRDLFETLGQLRRGLRSRNLKLLLLCDEVEELIKLHRKDPALLRRLRRAMQSQEDCRSILASTIRLWELSSERGDTSPFLHGFTPPLYIRGLSDDEARSLIRQANLSSDSRPRFEDSVVEEIRKRCDNHPYLIQLVCKRCLELGDLNAAVEEVASDQMVSYFFSVDFEMLADAEKDVLRIIADKTTAGSDSLLGKMGSQGGELSGILYRLEQLGFIRRNSATSYELVNYFFRRWFKDLPDARLPQSATPASPARVAGISENPTVSVEMPQEPFDGRYRLLGELGRGATGVVYKAYDEVLREGIALKMLKPEYSAHEEVLERFRREILLARDIGHPNILKVYHLGECQGRKYLAMKWIDGPSLARLIKKTGPFEPARMITMSRKLASALEAAHAQQVLHRDIKSHNILVDASDEPYLTDFGLARLVDSPGMTQDGVFVGTPDYASPEQARLQPTDERSDLYALGVVMYEMATGRRPFSADTSQKVLELHRTMPPPDPKSLRPSLPSSLARVILRCLEKDPSRRFPSARLLKTALEELRSL
jgi:protein kinase-like protein